MGHKLIQKIYTCDVCNKTPEDGEVMWHMGYDVLCEDCCEKEQIKSEELKE